MTTEAMKAQGTVDVNVSRLPAGFMKEGNCLG